MKIDRRLTLLGVMLVILSTVMATQYATTEMGYQYGIVHPSNADIRYIGSDNNSDGHRILKVPGNASGSLFAYIYLGNWSAGTNKSYTAAFGIVNEEQFAVNITHITASTGAGNYLQIWLHGDRDAKANDDSTSVFMYNNGTVVNGSGTTAWTMARGDGVSTTICSNVSNRTANSVTTTWDNDAGVQFTTSNTDAKNADLSDMDHEIMNASDFVWVQVSLNVSSDATAATNIGALYIHYQATTYWGTNGTNP